MEGWGLRSWELAFFPGFLLLRKNFSAGILFFPGGLRFVFGDFLELDLFFPVRYGKFLRC